MKKYDSIVVLGATASGKTKLAVAIAGQINGEILSIDSRMVYKQMDIGTGKDLNEYVYQNKPISYHLMNICEPHEKYHIYQFQQDFKLALKQIQASHKFPILCGGSGLYLEAVIKDFTYTSVPTNASLRTELEAFSLSQLQEHFIQLPPHSFKEVADLGSKKRAIRALEILYYLQQNLSFTLPPSNPLNPFIIGLNPNLEHRRKQIILRLHQRLEQGLIEEVSHLLAHGISQEKLISLGLEYKFVTQFLAGEFSKETMINLLGIAIQQFAKRQMTYFRKMEKSGLTIHWANSPEMALNLLKQAELIP
ncbi:MAG: tRNA (adenosine(37)-N6)-dimethylallyltransferase MiaA [Bacteroidota bacterium]|nr:tRNA (adenosine(37)-N6)-dimethylallyltransferase MiaA [Bacteroidota bacterium]